MHTRHVAVVLLAGLLAASLAAPAAAQSGDGSDDALVDDLDALATTYNENLESVPGVFADRLAHERVDVRVATGDGERQYAAETGADARVESIERGEGDREPTVRVRTDAATLDRIRTADRPAETALDAYDSGDIEITGVGVVNTVTVETTKAAVAVGRFLGLV